MGYLSYFGSGGGGSGLLHTLQYPGTTASANNGPDSSQDRGFPERFELKMPDGPAFHSLSQSGADIFAAAGRFPGQVTETPVALFDQLAQRYANVSPVDSIGQIPGVGQAVGFLGEALERTGNFIPALLNSQDANMLMEYGDKPDDFELPWYSGQRAEGVPILGAIPGLQLLFSRAKTVGELKAELAKRGFLNDPETGMQRSWAQVIQALKSGQTSKFDFGYASINDNPLVDLAGRLALDPTNALFLIPGANVVKGAEMGARIAGAAGDAIKAGEVVARASTSGRAITETASNLVRTGLRSVHLPPPVVAREAVATGDAANATMRGWASYFRELISYPASASARLTRSVVRRAVDPRGYLGLLEGGLTATSTGGRAAQAIARGARGYAKSSAALSAGLASAGYTAGVVDNALGGNTWLQGFHDFVLDVENDNPLSDSAAWMVASAFSFPYGDLVRAGKAKIGPETLQAFGTDFAPRLAKDLGFKNVTALHEALGGPNGTGQLIVYLLKHRAKSELDRQPLTGSRITNAPTAAMRAAWSDEALTSRVVTMLRENRVDGRELSQIFQDWHQNQMGMQTLKGRQIKADPRAAPWNPELAVKDWKAFASAMEGPGATLHTLHDGAMTLGLRPYVFAEAIDDSIRPRLSQARDADVVPQSAITEVVSDHPGLSIMDETGFWKNAILPDANPVTWGQVRRQLAKQAKDAPTLADEFAAFDLAERQAGLEDGPSGVETADARLERLNAELENHRAADGTILENDRSTQLQNEIAAEIARRAEVDRVRLNGEDATAFGPEAARVLGKLDEEATPNLHFDPTTYWFDADMRQTLTAVERELVETNPRYTVKALPKSEILVQMRKTDPELYKLVATRTLLGELMFDRGPVAPFTNFVSALFRPVKSDRRARAARQALYQRLIPDGAKPQVVDAWIQRMATETQKLTVEPRGVAYHLFRDVASLPATTINRLAREVFGENSKVVAKWDGRFHDLLDMSASGMWRGVREQVRKGGKKGELARAVEAWGEFYREGPVISAASDVGRLVGKTFYHWFRFLLDPRWHAMNLIERNFLGGAEDGIRKGTRELSASSQFYLSGARRVVKDPNNGALLRLDKKLREGKITPDEFQAKYRELTMDPLVDELTSGWYYGRGLSGWIARSFDHRRQESTIAALNSLADSDVAGLASIRTRLRRDANADLVRATEAFNEGRITSADLEGYQKRAQLDIENSTADLATLLDDKLYRFDQQGVLNAMDTDARSILDANEYRVMKPLLDVLYQRNEELWRDVNRLYHGNPERGSLERIANSYWFYWPISYQIKAVKWLGKIMLDGSFGHDNNALLAGRYAQWHEQHQERFANNPAYAAMFKEQKELWFLAQMILPMSPDGIGVSLSRPVRLAGSWLGLFSEYKQAQDPLSAVNYITDMGPIYSWHLLQDVGRELFSGNEENE